MVKYFVLIKSPRSKSWTRLIAATRFNTKTGIKKAFSKRLKNKAVFKIITEPQAKRFLIRELSKRKK